MCHLWDLVNLIVSANIDHAYNHHRGLIFRIVIPAIFLLNLPLIAMLFVTICIQIFLKRDGKLFWLSKTIHISAWFAFLRPHPHVSGNLWKRKFFFTNTGCVHTYPAYFPAVSGNFWKRSPEWKFFYPIRIRIRVDGRIRKFANTLTSFSLIQSSRRTLNKHGVQQGCVFFVNCSGPGSSKAD